ncbi:MAG: hypothetical protein WCK58_16270 [Chloroflexota bacterium]
MAVLEIVRFRARAGVDEAELARVNERFQREVAPLLPGLERREATRTEDGEWVLVLRYRDAGSAARAMGSDTSEVSGQLMTMIDMATMSLLRTTVVSE